MKKFLKKIGFCLLVLQFFNPQGYGVLEEEEDSGILNFQVYCLNRGINIEHALKEKEKGKKEKIQYSNYPCRTNAGALWYTKPKSRTKPVFWEVVAEGAGVELPAVNERNTGEHWLYYVPGKHADFAVVFGQGDFLRVKKYEDQDEEGNPIEYFALNDEFGDPRFGIKVVQNLVKNPKKVADQGTLAGKPFNRFADTVRGFDYCTIQKRAHLSDIPDICERLWYYAHYGDRFSYDTVSRVAHSKGRALREATAQEKQAVETVLKKSIAEQEEVEVAESDIQNATSPTSSQAPSAKKIKYVSLFGELYRFDGLEEYYAETAQATRDLLLKPEEFPLHLPPFNKEAIAQIAKARSAHNRMPATNTGKKKTSGKERIDYEGIYNETTALDEASEGNFLLFDKKCVDDIEICDLFAQDIRGLVHVKIGTDSSVLNHLFGQGHSSANQLSKRGYSIKASLELTRKEILQRLKARVQQLYGEKVKDFNEMLKRWRDTNRQNRASVQKLSQEEKLLNEIEESQYDPEKVNLEDVISSLDTLLENEDLEEETSDTLDKIRTTLQAAQSKSKKRQDSLSKLVDILKKKLSKVLTAEEDLQLNAPELSETLEESIYDIHKKLKALQGKNKIQPDKLLKEIVDGLDPFRFDLLEDYFNKTWREIIGSQHPKSYEEMVRRFSEAHKGVNEKRISRRQLVEILNSEDLTEYYETLTHIFPKDGSFDPEQHTVVYAIATSKDPDADDLIPLCARINLLTLAKTIHDDLHFKVGLKLIPDTSTKKADSTASSQATGKKGAGGKSGKKGGKTGKKGMPSLPPGQQTLDGSRPAASNAPNNSPAPSAPPPARPPLPPQDPFERVKVAITQKAATPPQESLEVEDREELYEYLHTSPHLRVHFRANQVRPADIQESYTICPVIGDGECFFHSLFTESEEDKTAVKRKARDLREEIVQGIKQSPELKGIIGNEIIETYFDNLYIKNDIRGIPAHIVGWLKENTTYENGRKLMKKYGITTPDALPEELHTAENIATSSTSFHEVFQQQNQTYKESRRLMIDYGLKTNADLPPDLLTETKISQIIDEENQDYQEAKPLLEKHGIRASNTPIHTVKDMVDPLSDQELADYLQRYLNPASGPDYYIQVPANGNGQGIAEAIAHYKNMRFHVCMLGNTPHLENKFLYHLNYVGTVGLPEAPLIGTILLDGNHFWSLYSPNDTEGRRNSIISAALNYAA